MNAEQLLQHFERISEAPDAIQRLRRFILDLAVRGMLVEQDPSDEPASELLKRIAAEKARVGVKHAVQSLNRDEVPFELPPGWSWSRIGEACSKTGSGSTPRGGKDVYKKAGTIFLRSQNVYDDGLRLNEVVYIDSVMHEKMSATRVLPGDLLLNITGGSMGRCCLVSADAEEANVSQHVAIIRAAVRGTESFLHKLVLSPYFQAFVFGEQTGAGRGGLPKNRMDKIAVALPPLAEQHRIVAKVDELMNLCDQLEAAKAEREKCRDSLVAASLQRLNQPAEEEDTFREHARFTFNNLPRITTRVIHIKQLRQTILNLAVRGMLVEQDPGDEPATELLKRIAADKARLVKDGFSKSKLLARVNEEEHLFTAPSNWTWQRIGTFTTFLGGFAYESPRFIKASSNQVLRLGNVKDYGIVAEANPVFITDEYASQTIKYKLKAGDVLVTMTGTKAKKDYLFSTMVSLQDLADAHLYLNQRVGCLRGIVVQPEFIELLFKSEQVRDALYAQSTGTANQANIGSTQISNLAVSLPPVAEQHRIVAKVDELMAICDQLEAQITATEQDSRRFLESVLAEALAPGIECNHH